ncbi:MAG: DUF3467 domain-containing protein [Candidatus Woesearchaeota archaeon]
MEQKINMTISDGDAFYAHQASINFNPTMVFFDFKSITPRVDERDKGHPTLAVKHNVVMVDPYHALLFKDLLTKVIQDYEKQFGKIEVPKAIKHAEKKQKKSAKGMAKRPNETPTYFG